MASKSLLTRLTLCGLLSAGFAGSLAPAAFAASDLIKDYDTDNDGTLDLAEAKAAAAAEFDTLNKDSDDTLDRRETKGIIGKGEFVAGDPDKDGTLDKAEYLSIVEKLFKAADKDNDGTLDAKELDTRAGRALEKLID